MTSIRRVIRRIILGIVVAAAVVGALKELSGTIDTIAGPVPTASTQTPPRGDSSGGTDTYATTADYRRALETLGQLQVKDPASMHGYSRDLFGPAWSDDTDAELAHNGCDTRNDILQRDLDDVRLRSGSTCVVSTGVLHDPYTGTDIAFTRGVDTSAEVQIDHVVALADAWQTGAQSWSSRLRETYANDPQVLQASQGRANQAKGASDAADWLPSNAAYRCEYVARQVEIKAAYDLWVTGAEHDAMTTVLKGCV